jgi:hypothetical protein
LIATASPTIATVAETSGYPVQFDIEYPERLSRWLWLFKWLLVIPHFFVLFGLGIAAAVCGLIAWWGIFFTGKYPEGLWNFVVRVQRWSVRVTAYAYLMRDEYPPFAFDLEYPVQLDAERPPFYPPWRLFFTIFAVIPHLLLGVVYSFGYLLTLLLVPWAILILGRYPRGLFSFAVGVHRYLLRVQFYIALLSGKYPPFGMKA